MSGPGRWRSGGFGIAPDLATGRLANLARDWLPRVRPSIGGVYAYVSGSSIVGAYPTASERFTFSTQSVAAHTASAMTEAKAIGSSLSDTVTYGYYQGGQSSTGVALTTGERITFSTGALAASTANNLSAVREYVQGLSDSVTFGYVCGGDTGDGIDLTNVDRVTFSSSTTATSTNVLTGVRNSGLMLSDAVTFGYYQGGSTVNGGGFSLVSQRITFSTGVWATRTAADLSLARAEGAGLSGVGFDFGYTQGGYSGANVVTSDRVTFSTSIGAANTASNLTQGRGNTTHGFSDTAAGYVGGGNTPSLATTGSRLTNAIERLAYAVGTSLQMTTALLITSHQEPYTVSDGHV